MTFSPENSKIKEIKNISQMLALFSRSQKQKNKIYISDSEIIDLGFEFDIAMTADAISEEYQWKLITNPEVLGWMNIAASLSDLSAVGADPIGVLIGFNKDNIFSDEFEKLFWIGSKNALEFHNCYLLGGDVNRTDEFIVSCTAIGKRSKSVKLSRHGAKPNDFAYLTGPVGDGVSVGFANFVIKKSNTLLATQIESNFKPVARLKESHIISQFASSCIDTSDGFLSAVDFLLEINQFGINLNIDQSLFSTTARKIANQLKLPLILFSSIQLGEFELLFTVPESNHIEFENEMNSRGFKYFKIGQIKDTLGIKINQIDVDLEPIRNLLIDTKDPNYYLSEQVKWAHGYKDLF